MTRLTKEQLKILKLIAKGKYIFPDSDFDYRSKAGQNLDKLISEKLIDYDFDDSGKSYFKNFALTIEGQLAHEDGMREAKKDLRWWITTAIAILALLLHWFA